MFSAETTGLIFTKILHDIVALVANHSKTKPCYHLANVQRMHVVSVYLHFGNIIWLPWQRPWQIGEWGTDPSSACKALSYGEMTAKIGLVHPKILDDIRRTTTWTRNAISIRMFSAETTGPIFTKILHDIVALVASSSNTKPCYHLANVQRMHVVSVCHH